MATENLDGIYSLPAAADYSVNGQYQAVVVNASGQFALAGAGVRPHGILHNLPKAAEQARAIIAIGVVVKMKVGVGGVTLGGKVSSDATGKAVISVTSTHVIFGRALLAGAAGDIVPVLYLGYESLVP